MLRCMLCLNKAWAACANNRSGLSSAERSMTPDRDLKMCCMMLSQISPPKEQSETRPRRFIGYGDNFRWDWPHPASDIATSTQLPSYWLLHQSDVATLSVKHFQLCCKPAFKDCVPGGFVFDAWNAHVQCEEAWLSRGWPEIRGSTHQEQEIELRAVNTFH